MIWVNGEYIDRHMSGYTEFCFEISDNLRYGEENSVAVRVDASQTEGWWYEGAGIYRHVYLVYAEPISLEPGSLFIRSAVSGKVDITCTVINETAETADVGIAFEAGGSRSNLRVVLAPFEKKEVAGSLTIEHPVLWSLENPHLYTLQTTVSSRGFDAEITRQNFGIREISFDAEKGFFLNGKHVFLRGACVHQDFACVGVALPDALQEYKIRCLKEMGVNAYRSSHHAPARQLVEACDRLGMLLMAETRKFGSSPEALSQLEALVKSFRNNPSVILWSIGNEEHSTQNNARGKRIAQSMMRTVRRLDNTRPITYGGNNGGSWEGINECVDVRGFNYLHIGQEDYIKAYHRDHPNQPMVGSEEASSVYNRGALKTDFVHKTVSCYDENTAPWGSTAEGWLKYYRDHPYIAGGFLWTGFDYSGEPYPHHKNSVTSFGLIDLCGYPKDIFYYYKSWWTKEDVLHLFPHWNHKEGEIVRVCVYTNCEEAELFLNGKRIGQKKVEYLGHAQWQVPFEPGRLEAVGYRGGKAVLREARVTSGASASIRLRVDNQPRCNGTALVTAEVLDSEGNAVCHSGDDIRFTCTNGRILGVGNGNPSSYEPNQFVGQRDSKALAGWTEATADGERPYDVTEESMESCFTRLIATIWNIRRIRHLSGIISGM